MLDAGCQQKPNGSSTIGLQGEVFSTQVVNATAPSISAQVNPAWFDQGPLTLGAKVGIAIGGFVLLLALAGFCVVWNGKRRRRAHLRRIGEKYGRSGWPTSPQDNQGEMFETPVSQRPLRGWDDSPTSAHTESTFPRYFSPYSSQFNSPVSALDATAMPWPEAALTRAQDIGVAIGGNHSPLIAPFSPEGSSSREKGQAKRDETYEMHEVDSASSGSSKRRRFVEQAAPVLSHPGFGRKSDSPPRRYDVDEDGRPHA